jgi:hypothetical protein
MRQASVPWRRYTNQPTAPEECPTPQSLYFCSSVCHNNVTALVLTAKERDVHLCSCYTEHRYRCVLRSSLNHCDPGALYELANSCQEMFNSLIYQPLRRSLDYSVTSLASPLCERDVELAPELREPNWCCALRPSRYHCDPKISYELANRGRETSFPRSINSFDSVPTI